MEPRKPVTTHSHSTDRPKPVVKVVWARDESWSARLMGPGGPVWGDLKSDSRAVVVKSNALRRVWRVRGGAFDVIVKEFRKSSTRKRIKEHVRGSDAARERKMTVAALDLGVSVSLVAAHLRGGGREWLVFETLRGSRTLSEAWLGARAGGRFALVDALADTLAVAHGRGLRHGDLHPGNVLVAEDGAAYLIDLSTVKIVPSMSVADEAESLAQINQWFRRVAPRNTRLAFLRRYCLRRCAGDREKSCAMFHRLTPGIGDATHRQSAELWGKRDGRILQGERHFASIELSDGAAARVVLRFRRRELFPPPRFADGTREACAERLNRFESCPEGVEIREGRSSELRETFVAGHRLRHRDLPVRWMLALIESRGQLWVDAHPETERLVDVLRSADRRRRRAVVREVGRTVALMADRGVHVRGEADDVFSFTGDNRILIEKPLRFAFGQRNVEQDRVEAVRSLRAMADRAGSVGTRTDAVRLLHSISPRGWKELWPVWIGD